MNTLLKRSITAVVYGIVVLGCALGGKITFPVLGLLFIIISMLEFLQMSEKQGLRPLRIYTIFTGIAVFAITYSWANGLIEYHYFLLLPLLFLALVSAELFRNKLDSFGNIAISLLAVIYIALPVSLMSFLVLPGDGTEYDPRLLIYVIVQIWAFDTGAYLSGVSFGKHKLSPRLSPNKSWEGIAGGVVFVILAAVITSTFYKPFDIPGMVIAAVLVAIGSTLGDLAESMLKRNAEVKDSGSLLPGHGGLLDRIDSLLFVVPLLYVFIWLYK